MEKTVVVEVTRLVKNARYGRYPEALREVPRGRPGRSAASRATSVEIEETRPLSARKRWRVKAIVTKGRAIADTAESPTPRARPRGSGSGKEGAVIQMGTILEVADNSGARRLFCIRLQGGSTGDYGRIGDVITCSVKESNPDAPDPVKKGKVVKAVIVRTVREQRRRDGSYIRFDTNAAVLDQQREGADRHPCVRAGRARAPREEVHEDHLAARRKSSDHEEEEADVHAASAGSGEATSSSS